MLQNIILKNRYFDSATLMLLTNKVKQQLNLSSQELAIMMATEMNKRIMDESQLLNDTGKAANPGDLLVAIVSELSEAEIVSLVEATLNAKKAPKAAAGTKEVTSVAEACEAYPESNLAVISLPGIYAAHEANKLLRQGVNVLMFSDNVTLEDEVKLKKYAVEHDLLMMGPDCGTAYIHGVGLGFANKVNQGPIGVVAASGTGLQEAVTIVSNYGGGISHGFGTGGRDIQDAVGGLTMLYCLDLLIKDESTETILIVSKPPQQQTLTKILTKLQDCPKPVVACFLGADPKLFEGTKIHFEPTLGQAAFKALELNGIKPTIEFDEEAIASKLVAKLQAQAQVPTNLRAVYCGGTLAYEALLLLKASNFEVYSNLQKQAPYKLHAKDLSQGHTVLDMGEDEFTVGKPHPMIDPTLRSERFLQEALDPSVGIILADVELGYGSHDQAADMLAQDIKTALEQRPDLVPIVVICGSEQDYQGYQAKKALLEQAGAFVAPTNDHAVKLVINILEKLKAN